MRIDFTRKINERETREEFGEFFKEMPEQQYDGGFFSPRYVIFESYDLRLNSKLSGEIVSEFGRNGFTYQTSGANIWVSSLQHFSLDLRTRRGGGWQIGTREISKKGLFGKKTRNVEIHRELLNIDVFGGVKFEESEEDPSQVLKILTDLKYAGRVVTTAEEMIEAQRVKSACSYSSSRRAREKSSAGTIVGAGIGGATGGISGAIIGGVMGSLFDD